MKTANAQAQAKPAGAQAALPVHDGSAVSIEMTVDKECKNSVRYATSEPGALVSNVYVDRRFDKAMPDKILVTIEAAP